MSSNRCALLGAALAGLWAILSSAGCGSSDEPTTEGDPTTVSDAGTEGDAATETTSLDGAPCDDDAECDGGLCQVFQDAPPVANSTCHASQPAAGTMRITGTVRDLVTGSPAAGVSIRAVGALGALSSPAAAEVLASTTTAADGRFAMSTDALAGVSVGIVALTQAAGGYFTATGLADPLEGTNDYPPTNTIHDVWIVTDTDLQAWSAALSVPLDPEVQPYLPLGENGGIIGFVRDPSTGEPISGAVVSSLVDDSEAIVRYLSDDGTAVAGEATGALGLFIVLNPELAEPFQAEASGQTYGPNLGGSAPNLAFVMTLE